MDIVCPNCAATYRVPDALLAPGKALRCAACGESWVPAMPPMPEPAPAAGPAPEPVVTEPPAEPRPDLPEPGPPEAEAAPPQPAPARPASPMTPPPLNRPPLQGRSGAATRRSGAWLRLAWVASIAAVLLVLAGLVFYGDAIAAAWPPFARVAALLGG